MGATINRQRERDSNVGWDITSDESAQVGATEIHWDRALIIKREVSMEILVRNCDVTSGLDETLVE